MSDYREGFRFSGLAIVFGAVALVVVLILTAMAVFGFGLFSKATANFRGSVQQANQTRGNGSFRIAAYDQFYNECAQIQKDEASIIGLKSKLSSDAKGSQQQSIDQTDYTAAVISRSQDIAQYNADARKTATEGAFRASDLPFQIDPTIKETSCTA